jgi:hypothetical protein
MSNEFKHGQRHSRYFMAPVWIALALCAVVSAFLLGGYLIADDWSRQDKKTLDAYKSVNPSSVLELAAEAVKHDRIEFGVYRDLLRASFAQQEAGAHEVAWRSIRDVLQYGGAFANDLRAELKQMAPQVFITTTTSPAGMTAGTLLEKELRDVGETIVNRQALDPAQISESKVFCYSADTCKDAKALVPVLRSKGYTLGEADTSNRAEDNSSDEATMLYNAKVIRVVLLDPKQSQSTTQTPAAPVRTLPRARRSALHARPIERGVRTAHQSTSGA